MPASRQDLIECFIELTSQVFIQMRPAPSDHWSNTDLTIPQLRALIMIWHQPHRMGTMAELLVVSVSSATLSLIHL